MRELLYEIKQLTEGRMLDLHRHMLRVKYDAVLIIIYIRRILESPLAAVNGHRNDTVVLTGRMVHTTCITLIFTAQQAFRITGLLCQLCCGDSFGILLGLGQVDGNIQIAIFGGSHPFHILADTIAADIIGISAQFIIIVGSCLRRYLLVQLMEMTDHFTGSWHQQSHDLRIEQIAVYHAVLLENTFFISVIQHALQNLFQFILTHGYIVTVFQLIQFKQLQQTVGGIDHIFLRNQSCLYSVGY